MIGRLHFIVVLALFISVPICHAVDADETLLLREIEAARKRMLEDKSWEHVSFGANFKQTLLAAALITEGNPNRPEFGGTRARLTPLEKPAVTEGTLQYRRFGSREWLEISPARIADFHKHAEFGSRRIAGAKDREITILLPEKRVAIIDNRHNESTVRPKEMWFADTYIARHFGGDWASDVAGIPETERDVLKGVVMERMIVERGNAEVTVREDVKFPGAKTVFGEIVSTRIARWEKAVGVWRPVKVEQLVTGRLRNSVEIKWSKHGSVFLASSITVRTFASAEMNVNAKDLPTRESAMQMIPQSIVLGAAVEKLKFDVEIPDGTDVKRFEAKAD